MPNDPQNNNQSDDDTQLPANAAALSDDLEKEVHDVMDEFDLDEDQAKQLKKLEDEGYDQDDALAQVLDA